MASKFVLGKGSTFGLCLTSNGTSTPVKQIQQVDYSGGKMDFDDITNLDSPGAVREWVPTLNDAGQASLSGVFADSDPGQQMFIAAYNSQSLLYVQMQMAPAAGETVGFLRTFTAYVAEPPNYSYSTTKAMSFKGSLKITGPINDTPGH